jgi:hypothetical protein
VIVLVDRLRQHLDIFFFEQVSGGRGVRKLQTATEVRCVRSSHLQPP